MINLTDVREHMQLLDRNGNHLGIINGVEDDRVKLTRADSIDGRHHYADTADLDHVEGGKMMLRSGAKLSEAEIAAASDYHANARSPLSRPQDRPIFGTSGNGTGMGGSGSAQH